MTEKLFWQVTISMSAAYIVYYLGLVILNTPLPR